MKQVFVVDYDLTMLKSVEQTLQDRYRLSLFTSGVQAIEGLVNNHPDLILLAASMPVMDGYETYLNIKDLSEMKGVPVIFLLEQNDAEVERRVINLGADDFIVKPITTETLLRRVETHLELQAYRNDKLYEEKLQDAISVSFAELVECRDETTGGHLKNTTRYFKILLEEALKHEEYKKIIPREDISDLLRSAPLHDIGKIGINDDILRKASSLDYHEYEYMKTHTTLGKQAFERIIQETGGSRWLYLARDIAYCHHEHWDGTGYPNGLKGEEIPLYARMLTIADVYDAITSRRAYKEACSHEIAMDMIIEGKGSLFDPGLVEVFVEAEERFEQALLVKQNKT